MLFLKADSKWGVKVLTVAFLLLLSLQILSWSGRPLVQLPCPLPQREHTSRDTSHDTSRTVDDALLLPPNSYFPEADSDVWYCKQHHVNDEHNFSYTDWVTRKFTDEQVLCAAHRRAKQPLAAGTPRIAFLFITRGSVPLEPLWAKFFHNHEEKFSLYVHASDPGFQFPAGSLFHNRTIPSNGVDKFSISLPEAVRRLLSYALLDAAVPNAWFHLACDASVPIRGFNYIYDYITNSHHSFVEAFYPAGEWWRSNWSNTTWGDMAIPDQFMRKGEFWITLHRRHAGVVVGDQYVFPRFKHHWGRYGLPSEIYIPTLLTLVDPEGTANRSLVYVNWFNNTRGSSSPLEFNDTNVTPVGIRMIQSLTKNAHGFYNVDKRWDDQTEKSCVYNGVPYSPCFLFARKFVRDASVVARLLRLSGPVLEYG